MDFRRCPIRILCLLPAVLWGGLVEGAGAPCVDNTTIERATLSPASAKHFYLECAVVTDSNHPFLARLPAERRAAAAEGLRDRTAQTLACSAVPRDPARTGLAKKDMIVLTSCKPARVGDVWALQ